jgi:hypothetical protein
VRVQRNDDVRLTGQETHEQQHGGDLRSEQPRRDAGAYGPQKDHREKHRVSERRDWTLVFFIPRYKKTRVWWTGI